MHMADALLSPAVGGTFWALSAGTIALSARKLREQLDDARIPLMGVLAAFIFAAQMINFTIPGTGSSGHLGGGMILAILLGPWAAFIAMASVLTVQALFFADGGLLALGCNIFNLGFFTCFVAYPLIYKPVAGGTGAPRRIAIAALLAAVVGLQCGAFAVVVQTTLSGVSALPFQAFVVLMQPIHLAIGVVEGVVTASVVTFVWRCRPEVLSAQPLGGVSLRQLLVALVVATGLVGGVLSWFASTHPDGLEWAITKVAGEGGGAAAASAVHAELAKLQEQTAILPDYAFKKRAESGNTGPSQETQTSAAGLLGGGLTLLVLAVSVLLLRKLRR